MARRHYIATLFNAHPKAMTLVNISASGPYAESTNVRMAFPGASFEIGGGGYTEDVGADKATEDYARFHFPGAALHRAEWASRGYGFTLMAGAALTAEALPIGDRTRPDENLLGIYSEGMRTPEASCLWAALQCSSDAYVWDGRSREVQAVYSCKPREKGKKCDPIADQIDAPHEPAAVADVLRASRIRQSKVIVNLASDNDREFAKAPADLVLNTRLDPEAMTYPVLVAIAATLQENYGKEVADTFLSRPDVLAVAGGERGVAGLAGLAGLGQFKRRKVPPISASSRKLQHDLFVGVP